MSLFPPSFDMDVYKLNDDLSEFTDTQLYEHYTNYGRNEGRIANIISSIYELTKCIPPDCKCLEINPRDAPALKDKITTYFHTLNRDELIETMVNLDQEVEIDNIPPIHYWNIYGDLSSITDTFDVVYSNKIIHTQVNLINHLNQVSKLLHQDGYYIVICPDKRYQSTHFVPESTIADIMDQDRRDDICSDQSNPTHNSTHNITHNIKSLLYTHAFQCHNDEKRHWNNDHGEVHVQTSDIKHAIDQFHHGYPDNYSIQSLFFTPDSFGSAMTILNELNITSFVVDNIYPTRHNQSYFIAVLRKQ